MCFQKLKEYFQKLPECFKKLPNKAVDRLFLFGLMMALVVVFISIIMFLIADDVTLTPVIIFFSMLVALTGWLVAAGVSLYNSTKQHTINILLQSRLSDTFKGYREKTAKSYPENPKLICVPQKDIDEYLSGDLGKDKTESLDAMKYLLNYYEFIAAGILSGDLDETLLKTCLRGIILNNCKRAELFIKMARELKKDGEEKDSDYYGNLLRLKERWST
ncbi:MAG: DUF4760 domain-containing protein [Gammaproteobacteria bacterium]|nr:DUF4760 domain-containing protein [Gammaproteobacteria bacterium]